MGPFFPGLYPQRADEAKTDDAEKRGNDEDDVVAKRLVQEHAGHRAGCESQVHADSEIADALATAARREGVDGNGVACRARNAEGYAVHKAQNAEKRDEAKSLVADKAEREAEKRPEVERLARKGIDKEACERAAGKGAHGI